MIFDTHAHYDDEQFDNDREALLASLFRLDESAAGAGTTGPAEAVGRIGAGLTEAAGRIGAVVDVASTPESLSRVMTLAETYDKIYAAIGIHPDEVGSITDDVWQEIRDDLAKPKTVAVGEIGLDYYWDKESHDLQEYWFRKQIELAHEFDKPINVHSRAAAEDTMRIIKDLYGEGVRGRRPDQPACPGIIHCYAYSVEMARDYVKMGFMLGIGGVVTYKNGRKLKEVVEAIPLEHLVLETDCPYLSPEPHRGKRNSSLNLPYVVQTIAELKGVTAEEVEKVTWENACRVYALHDF